MPALITPPQKVPPSDGIPSLFGKIWWLFFNAISTAGNAAAAAIVAIEAALVIIQARLVVLLDAVLGASVLTNNGKLAKVSAVDGTLAESSLTDDGSAVSGTEPLHLDVGATAANSQIVLQANALGALSLLCYSADNLQLMFDAERAAGGLVARDTSAARLLKMGDQLLFQYANTLTVGAAFTFTTAAVLDLLTGRFGFGGNAAPGYEVDATGQINAASGYRAAGVNSVSGFITLAKITPGGANGSITITGGIVTGSVAPT